MNARSTNHPAANLFGRLSSLVRPSSLVRIVLPVVAVLALSACVTDGEYARQLRLQNGVSSGSSGYDSCLGEQRNWIENNRQRDTFPHLNG